jgi:DNA-binding response OmpR family regulator
MPVEVILFKRKGLLVLRFVPVDEGGKTMSLHSNPNPLFYNGDHIIQRGSFIIDLQTQTAYMENRTVKVPHCTFYYLITLLEHSPHPVSYQDLALLAQGQRLPRLDAQDLVRTRIYLLRKVIEDDYQDPRFILAVPGHGYKLMT